MIILLMRVLYGAYFLGMAFIFYHLISMLIFQKEARELKFIVAHLLLIPIWPLALFSKPGRRALGNLIRRV